MNEKDPLQNEMPENTEKPTPEILTNEYDPATVVVDEETRTVLLTGNETVIIEKDPSIPSVPKDRPRKIYSGMWGPAEIGVVAAGALALLALIVFYVFVVARSNSEVEAKKKDRHAVEQEVTSAKSKYGDITNTKTHVAKLLTSVDDFEVQYLPVATIGQTALYQRINGSIAAHGLINSTGPNYLPLDVVDPNRPETEEESGRSKYKSLFPGLYISMTVEGSYQNLRRFIREMETTEQFLVISAIELEPADAEKKNQQPAQNMRPDGMPNVPNGPNGPGGMSGPFGGGMPQTAPTPSKGKTHGETVSLRIEMAAYFRRPNFVPQAPAETTEQ
jgi:hypothetical protein